MFRVIVFIWIFFFNFLYRCVDGYYGNLIVFGEFCVSCNCSGNVDFLEVGYCDFVIGECLRCIGNIDGVYCERCVVGYYGDVVIVKNCRGELWVVILSLLFMVV